MLEKEKVTSDKFDTLKKYYDETWDKNKITMHVGLFTESADNLEDAYTHATERLVGLLNERKQIDANSKIFDIGCGSGRTIVDLCDRYDCTGIGIDLSIKSLESARVYLQKINQKRKKGGKKSLLVEFMHGSGSELDNLLLENAQFTHIISQDAMFLMVNKESLLSNLNRLLRQNGAIAVADFLSEKWDFQGDEKRLIQQLVNWDNGLSFEIYQKALQAAGFIEVHGENHDTSMVETYTKLADRMDDEYVNKNDEIYTDLHDRYRTIVDSVNTHKMGWGIFAAIKK